MEYQFPTPSSMRPFSRSMACGRRAEPDLSMTARNWCKQSKKATIPWSKTRSEKMPVRKLPLPYKLRILVSSSSC